MTKIIAFSGRKQSGKNTSAHFVYGLYLAGTGQFKDVGLSNEGLIEVVKQDDTLITFEPLKYYLGIGEIDPEVMDIVNAISPVIKIYSFADSLKNDICMNILGLSYEQCYGSDEEKNKPTHIRWENMPGIITPHSATYLYGKYELEFSTEDLLDFGLTVHESGPMTSREIMEYVGTNIFRKIYNDSWDGATMSKIEREKPTFAMITDTRFGNEVMSVKKKNGKVIRLTRNPIDSDSEPETALDKENFDWNNFDHIIDNENLSIGEQCDVLYPIILEIINAS